MCDMCLDVVQHRRNTFLKLINNSSSDKPIACPHLVHMDARCYCGKEQCVWNQLEKAIRNLNKALLLLLFAVYIYVFHFCV